MLLSPIAQLTLAKAHVHDLQREAQIQRAVRGARPAFEAGGGSAATRADHGARSRRHLLSRSPFATRAGTKAGA